MTTDNLLCGSSLECPVLFSSVVDISFRVQVGVLWMRARAVLCRCAAVGPLVIAEN
jgi:hypothetical protein